MRNETMEKERINEKNNYNIANKYAAFYRMFRKFMAGRL